MGPILVTPVIIIELLRVRRAAARTLLIALVSFAFLMTARKFSRELGIESKQDMIHTINENVMVDWGGGSGRTLGGSLGSVRQILLFLPYGTFTALFRPLPGDVFTLFGVLASLENVPLLWLLWLAIRRTRLRELRELPVLWAILLLVAWSSVYGFVSWHNLGAASRFRLQVTPVLLGLLLHLSRRRKKKAAASARQVAPA
jgi:hypothetical protein